MGPFLKDSDWTRQSFLVRADQIEDNEFERRIFSTTSLKFTDTTPGGNLCINPLPQFNATTDVRMPSKLNSSKGMGVYYSEAIDDHNQIIHMRFGVAQFNSLTQFFTSFYNSEAGYLARTGRSKGAFFTIGKAIGYVVPLIVWPLAVLQMSWVIIHAALDKPSSKYCFLKPTMPNYWQAVQTMTNQIAVNKNIIPRVFSDQQKGFRNGQNFDDDNVGELSKILPDIFHPNGSIDVFATANKAQRAARVRYKRQAEMLGDATKLDLYEKMKYSLDAPIKDVRSDFESYLKKWFSSANSKMPGDPANEEDTHEATTEALDKSDTANAGFFDFLKAEFDDGAAFASFRVNATGSVSESFSNAVQDSEIMNKMNGMSSASRSTNFSLANGNIGGGAIGAAVQGIMGAAADVVSGVLQGLGASGLAMLGGSAFVDIPKHWQSSAASLPRASYTMRLTSVYGNPISQMLNIYMPLAMILAGALPISTGKQSYTSPFLLELYDKGRCQTRFGIIDSLQITRGTSNLSFNVEGNPMAIDVTFSVMDLTSILHMPLMGSFSLNPTEGVFDDETAFTDYMAVLGSMDLKDQIYSWNRFKNNLTKKLAAWESFTSPATFASFMGSGTSLGRLASVLYRGSTK